MRFNGTTFGNRSRPSGLFQEFSYWAHAPSILIDAIQKPRSKHKQLLKVFDRSHACGHSCSAQHHEDWARSRHSLQTLPRSAQVKVFQRGSFARQDANLTPRPASENLRQRRLLSLNRPKTSPPSAADVSLCKARRIIRPTGLKRVELHLHLLASGCVKVG